MASGGLPDFQDVKWGDMSRMGLLLSPFDFANIGNLFRKQNYCRNVYALNVLFSL